jgi:glycosyltransferase involved in cell wall biosynthesis
MRTNGIKVLYTGTYNRAYARNVVIRRGLKENGVDVVECWIDPAFSKIRQCKELISRLSEIKKDGINAIIAAEMNHRLIPIIWLFSRLKKIPLIFDPFVSQYDSMVFDRKKVKPRSLKALYYYCIDKISMRLAEVLLADTNEHRKYFQETFNIRKEIRIVPVGADEKVFYPRSKNPGKDKDGFGKCRVLFWGTFIPLHGIQHIIGAAELLKEEKGIEFYLVGDGQTFKAMKNLCDELGLDNVHLLGFVQLGKLADLMDSADVCLGIFGDTAKAKRVVPNKVWAALAMRKAVITGDSLAIRELSGIEQCVYLVPLADAGAIADAVAKLVNDVSLRRDLADKGFSLFKENLTCRQIGKKVKDVIISLDNVKAKHPTDCGRT